MTLESLVLRSLRHRRLATALSALAVALGVGLVIGIDTLRREARAHFENAAVSWDLIVGPKGSPMSIVQDGDVIFWNYNDKSLTLRLTETEIKVRLSRWKEQEKNMRNSFLYRYAKYSSSSALGAILA